MANEAVTRETVTREAVTRETVTREAVTRETVTRETVTRETVTHERLLRDLVDAIGRQHHNGFVWDRRSAECVCVCGCTRDGLSGDHEPDCPFRSADVALYGAGPEAVAAKTAA